MAAHPDPAGFILANTALEPPSLVPELRLHIASEALPLWQKTEDELEQAGLPPPYWAFAWAGGQALARYVIDHPEVVRGRRLLDVAAGGGVAGLAALWASAAHVTANEIDAFAAAAIALNARVNGMEDRIEVVLRDMTAEPTVAADGGPLWDVVLAGDVCYERPMAEMMIPWLRRHAAAGALVLIGDPGRAYVPTDGIEEIAVYRVPTSRELEDNDIRRTKVLRLLPG